MLFNVSPKDGGESQFYIKQGISKIIQKSTKSLEKIIIIIANIWVYFSYDD